MSDLYVLGLDPGFASVGYAVVRITRDSEQPVKLGIIRTEKSSGKRNVRASDDNLERAKEIAAELQAIVRQYDVKLICAETMSYPRNAAAAAKMAMCWGVLAALAHQHSIPVAQATPQEVKKALCHKKDASKEEVQEAVRRVFTGFFSEEVKPGVPLPLSNIPKSLWEHPCDALATVVACRESEVLLLVRRMAPCAV